MLTRKDVAAAFERLSRVFNRPFDRKADAGALNEYTDAMNRAGLDVHALAKACDVVLEADGYFPTPSRIIEAWRQWCAAQPRVGTPQLRQQFRLWLARDMGARPCPVCGRSADFVPRLYAQCDPFVHASAGIPTEAIAPEDLEAHRKVWNDARTPPPPPASSPVEAMARDIAPAFGLAD